MPSAHPEGQFALEPEQDQAVGNQKRLRSSLVRTKSEGPEVGAYRGTVVPRVRREQVTGKAGRGGGAPTVA